MSTGFFMSALSTMVSVLFVKEYLIFLVWSWLKLLSSSKITQQSQWSFNQALSSGVWQCAALRGDLLIVSLLSSIHQHWFVANLSPLPLEKVMAMASCIPYQIRPLRFGTWECCLAMIITNREAPLTFLMYNTAWDFQYIFKITKQDKRVPFPEIASVCSEISCILHYVSLYPRLQER